jgi:pimeloyl-ACP methyl ester carboxylesterase
MYTEHLRIPVGAGSLHVERVGRAGPAVVLLHGFGSCSFLWRAVAPRLADAGYTALAIDLLGQNLGTLIGLLQAPATKIAQLSTAPAAKLARVFGAYANKDAA